MLENDFTLLKPSFQSTKLTMNSSRESSLQYTNANDIKRIDLQNIVHSYFEVLNEGYTEVEIKHLIAARLQPTFELPSIHDTQSLSQRAKALLSYSINV